MMNHQHLAVPSVPVQSWGLLYGKEEALRAGTIFQDLNLPFFAAEEAGRADGPLVEAGKDSLLEIQQISFLLDDLRLYLDTHPEDPDGLALFQRAMTERKQKLLEFSSSFYPLTPDSMCGETENPVSPARFSWQEGPAPWEGGCV